MLMTLLKNTYSRTLCINTTFKRVASHRFFYQDASDQHDFKKFRLIKRLASTVLFGGTFLAVIWAKKRKKPSVFDNASLVTNTNFQKKFKLYMYNGYVLPSFVMKSLDNLANFVCREEDIFVVSFPKTGTTWIQEIIYCILNGINTASSQNMEDRFPYLEFVYPGIESIKKNQDQRLIKTHLPFSLLPEDIYKKTPKIICIMRNPKDVAVSYYHFVRMMTLTDYSASFDAFFQDFLLDKIPYGPIWKHYSDMWEHRNDPNVLVLFYEDLKKDSFEAVRKIAHFLNKDISDQEIKDIVEHCSFKNMAKNPNANYQHWDDLGIRKKDEAQFMRKGQVGDWKNYLTVEMNKSMDLWINEKIKDIYFTYENVKES